MDSEPLTITAAAPLIRSGELTPSDLLEQCLARIDRYEEKVRAWVYLDRERSRAEAAQLTDEIKAGRYRGPLHGIPVGIKDIIDVFDMPTGCGSKLWANSYARRDAACVQRLREAGALILGKTVTTPYAYLDPPPTRNPWDLARTPGGSSSGSAAAVACGMCLAALGTQTGGSITRPASYCGVCSLKPAHGRVSVDGVLPLAPNLDHVGVMANCVRDLATVFQAIAGPDSRPDTGEPDAGAIPDVDVDADLQDRAPTFLRLGGFFDTQLAPDLRPLYESAAARLCEASGASERGVPPSGFAELHAAHRALMSVEAASVHSERMSRVPGDYPPNIRALVSDGAAILATHYSDAFRLRTDLEVCLSRMLPPNGVFLTPATTSLPPTPETTGNPGFNSPWSFTGLPTVSVPAGWSADGLPFAVQLAGGPHGEAELLKAAAWCETVLEFARRLPPVS